MTLSVCLSSSLCKVEAYSNTRQVGNPYVPHATPYNFIFYHFRLLAGKTMFMPA